MKMTHTTLALIAAAAGILSSTSAFAGTKSGKAPAPAVTPAPETPFVTGTLGLTVNTHFNSYGQDIWAAGNSFSDPLFNPMLELNFDLGGGWTGIIGTWWDVNDNAPTTIGSSIQEIDVWGGFAYTMDKWKFTLLYQSWNYASQIEHIVDLKIAYNDGVLNPFLMLHGRTGIEIPGFDEGLVAQLGIGPSKTVGYFTFSFPVSVSFDTDGFHSGDAGFAWAQAGVNITYAISKHLSMGVGVAYNYTNSDVIPTNPDESFVSGSAGLTLTF